MLQFVKKHLFYFTYFPGILLLGGSIIYFNQQYLIPQSHPNQYYSLTSLNIFTSFMALLCFIQVMRISNLVPNNLPFPRVKTQLRNNHPYYIYHNKCDKEGDRFKPLRASHSSKYGCVVRFNNHCSWTNNCIGYRNHKAYMLLTFYAGINCFTFFILSILKYIDVVNSGINPMTQNETSVWMLLTVIAFILFLILFGLTLSTVQFFWKNFTYIELLKGVFSFNDKQGLSPNPFDLGFLSNFAALFQGELWTFWLPSTHEPRFDGTKFPMVPPITDDDKKGLFQQIQDYLKDPIERTITTTYEQFYSRESPQFKNAIFHYLGEEYTLEGPVEKKEEVASSASAKEARENEEHKEILAEVYQSA